MTWYTLRYQEWTARYFWFYQARTLRCSLCLVVILLAHGLHLGTTSRVQGLSAFEKSNVITQGCTWNSYFLRTGSQNAFPIFSCEALLRYAKLTKSLCLSQKPSQICSVKIFFFSCAFMKYFCLCSIPSLVLELQLNYLFPQDGEPVVGRAHVFFTLCLSHRDKLSILSKEGS